MEPFLKISVPFAVLSHYGKITEEKKIFNRWLEIGCFANFKIFEGILLIPPDLLLNSDIILENSSSIQWFIINESLHGFDK